MRDEVFIRGRVPMTKSEVRAVSLSKMELTGEGVLYDIGAGTGSVSIEAALSHKGLQVFAIEQKQEGVDLIRQNQAITGAAHVTVVQGTAPGILDGLPMPTHAFIGGSSGQMEEILNTLLERNPEVRIVVNIIALETSARMISWLEFHNIEAEIIQVQVSRAEKTRGCHLMKGQNPVTVISFGGKDVPG